MKTFIILLFAFYPCYLVIKSILNYFGIYFGYYPAGDKFMFYMTYVKIGQVYQDEHGEYIMITSKNSKGGYGGYNVTTNKPGVILTPRKLAMNYKIVST